MILCVTLKATTARVALNELDKIILLSVGKLGNLVIDILTSEDMESLVSWM